LRLLEETRLCLGLRSLLRRGSSGLDKVEGVGVENLCEQRPEFAAIVPAECFDGDEAGRTIKEGNRVASRIVAGRKPGIAPALHYKSRHAESDVPRRRIRRVASPGGIPVTFPV
jgi:hypothetical protein